MAVVDYAETRRLFRPLFLDNYDFILELMKWSATNREQKRHWALQQWAAVNIVCRISWHLEGQCASLEQAAKTAEEAVFRALEEFNLCHPQAVGVTKDA